MGLSLTCRRLPAKSAVIKNRNTIPGSYFSESPSSLFLLKKAQIYSQQNRLEEAIYQYEQVLCLNPNHLVALNQLGRIKKKMQKYQEAENYYQRLAQLNPKNPGIRL